jgi:hypothetical protein
MTNRKNFKTNRQTPIPAHCLRPNRAPSNSWINGLERRFAFASGLSFKAILLVALLVAVGLSAVSCGGSQKKKKPTYDLDRNPPAPAAEQAYYYKHTGPRPWSDGRQIATGGRLIVIPAQNPSENKSLWSCEEHFERADGVQVYQIDDKYRIHHMAVKSGDSEILIRYTPALPLRFLDLKKDEKKTYKSHFEFIDPQTTAPLEGGGEYVMNVERRYDLRIISPAGAYLCRQFIIHTSIETTVQDVTTTFKATINSYWCDDIGWFVREEYAFEPMLQNGQPIQPAYNAESVLTQYKPMDPNSLRPPGTK